MPNDQQYQTELNRLLEDLELRMRDVQADEQEQRQHDQKLLGDFVKAMSAINISREDALKIAFERSPRFRKYKPKLPLETV